ncbi:MAG: ribbon-helix-helix protein, CopG family [Anaerolineales bacterium]|nr:ribbon-helix-helix protein, CopG family [Anaerolineales bacterium]
MIRKQIYLQKKQNQALKRLAKQRGVSEAEVIRQAIDRETERDVPTFADNEAALEYVLKFALSLRERQTPGEAYRFDREELYQERQKRWTKK